MPPPWTAELPDIVVKLMFAVPKAKLEMPPPLLEAELPDTVLLVIVRSPWSLPMPPSVKLAVFLDNVLLVIVKVPSFWIPPPTLLLLLPDKVLLVTMSVLFIRLSIPPPEMSAVFLVSSTFEIVSVPEEWMMPPPLVPCDFPSLIVRPEIVTDVVWMISKTRDALLPLT